MYNWLRSSVRVTVVIVIGFSFVLLDGQTEFGFIKLCGLNPTSIFLLVVGSSLGAPETSLTTTVL